MGAFACRDGDCLAAFSSSSSTEVKFSKRSQGASSSSSIESNAASVSQKATMAFRRGSTESNGACLAGPSNNALLCDICGEEGDGLPNGDGFACRECLRKEDEARLKPSAEEQLWLDAVANTLNSHPYSYWKPGEQPAQILNWMFLGDLGEALDLPMLHRRGITAVLNVISWWELCSRLPDDLPPERLLPMYAAEGISYEGLDLEDRLFSDLDEGWPMAETYIQECFKEGRKVLVNCYAGHNRSAAIVVCWLVLREKWYILDALAHVQKLRGCVLSNHGYRLAIVRLAQKAELLVNPPVLQSSSPLSNGTSRKGSRDQASTTPLPDVIIKKRSSKIYSQQ